MFKGLFLKFYKAHYLSLISLVFASILNAETDTLNTQAIDFSANYDLSSLNLDDELIDENTGANKGPIDLGGFVKQQVAYSYQHENFKTSKILSSLNYGANIHLNKKWTVKMDFLASYDAAYGIEGREKFTKDTLDVYESDFRFREFYTDLDITSWMNIRVGRQYFSWGMSDSSQISDIGNPRDLREMGLINAEDARLPVGASKATFYGNSWEYNIIAIHEIRPHEFGTKGSEYDPFLAARSEQTMILDPDKPSSKPSNTEYLSRIFLSQSWGEISFFWGDTFDDFPTLDIQNIDKENQNITFQPVYKKVKSYGFFGNIVTGSVLFKFDVARKVDKPISRSIGNINQQMSNDQNTIISWQPENIFQWMSGIEYSGLSETFISLEYFNEVIEDHEDFFLDEKRSKEISFFISKDFLNDQITTSFWWNHLIGENSNLFRVDINYDYSDHINYSLALSGIESTDAESYFYDYRKTDRLTLDIKYSF